MRSFNFARLFPSWMINIPLDWPLGQHLIGVPENVTVFGKSLCSPFSPFLFDRNSCINSSRSLYKRLLAFDTDSPILHFDVIGVLAYEADGEFDEKKAKVCSNCTGTYSCKILYILTYALLCHSLSCGSSDPTVMMKWPFLPLSSLVTMSTNDCAISVPPLATPPRSIECWKTSSMQSSISSSSFRY